MKAKKVFTIVLSALLVLTLMPAGAFALDKQGGEIFSDMPNNWSTSALEKAVANGLLKGYAEGDKLLIKATAPIKRAEMAAVVNRAFGAVKKAGLGGVTDVAATSWYADDIAKAVMMGTFMKDNKMRPEDGITRQEAFTVLARAFKITSEGTGGLNSFTDKGQVAAWAENSLSAMVTAGYVQGSGGKINPKANISRAEFAVVMDNLVKQYIVSPGEVTEVVTKGNVLVRSSDVTLRNVTINGDLIIADGVGEGDVTLDGVTVTGRTVVRGGGENSILIKGNSSLGKVIVAKVDGKVRVAVEGGANVEIIYVDDGSDDVIVEGRFGELEVAGDDVTANAQKANIDKVEVSGDNSRIVIANGSKVKDGNITGNSSAIVADEGSSIGKVTISGSDASVSGKGEVKEVEVKKGGDGANVTTPNTKTVVDKDVDGVTSGNQEVQGGQTATNNATGDGATVTQPSTGGSGSGSNTKVSVSAITVAGDGGTEITTDGGTLQMIATVEPDNASNKNVTWSVDDSSIATINSEGLLTAKTNGTVKVTATAKDGSGKSGFAEITITNQRTLKSVSIEVETNSDPLLSKPVVDAKLKIKNLEPTEAGATVTYQWQRSDHWDEDFTDIEGEKAETYTVKKDDEGKYIRLLVTGTGDYKGTVDSDSIEILPTYTVSFDLQGGTTSDSTDPIKVVPFSTYETYGTFPTVTKTDHTFHGWFTEETGGFKIEEGSWIDGELFTENKLTLYARWIKADDVLLVGATGISGTKDDTYLNNEGKEDTTNWTVHYNSTSKTLTLKGYNGGSIEVLNGFGEETLNLVLEGDNKVNGTIKGNYDKTPEKGSSLKIRENGTGKLEVEGSIRMSGSGKIEINSGTIDIKNGQLYVDKGGIIISGGKVNITEEVEYSAIWLYSSDLTLSGDAEVDIDIKNGYWTYYLFAIRANNIEIKDSSKLGIKANAVEDSWGLDINHTGGTLKIESGTTVDIMTSTEQSHHEAKAIHFREPATGKFIVSRVETEAPTGPNYTHNPTTKIETVTITGFVGAETGQTPIKISDLQTTDTNYEIVGLTWYEGDGNGEPKKMATGAKFKGDSGYYYEAVIELSAKTDYHFVPKDPDKTQVNISIVPNDWYHGIAWTKSTSKKLLISVTNNPYQ